MKRYGNLWAQICARENIEFAAEKAIKGKPLTKSRRHFLANSKQMIDDLQDSLNRESYQFGPLYSFTVHEPKEREIHCPNFYPDRILHHALMNIVQPLFMSRFTADTYGSIKGRGVTLLGQNLSLVLKKNPDWYYLQVDIRKFYQSIDHDVAKEQISRLIKCKPTLRLYDSVIDAHSPGMPIGGYPSQYIGNLMLSPIDHWAKEVVRAKHYFRYMDDMLFIVPDKQAAHDMLKKLIPQVANLKLTIKNNARIAPITTGIDFVGYKYYPTHTRLRKRIKQRMQRTVRRLRKRNASDRHFMRKTASHFGWCIHADCRNLLRTTLKDKIYLYSNQMELKRLSEKKQTEWFGLKKDKRMSIEVLFNRDIAFFDFMSATIRGEDKVMVKFSFLENPENFHYFITRSDVMKDRLERDREHMPFIATIKRVKNYTAYE
jgi:RNA-directed DNA polymerase